MHQFVLLIGRRLSALLIGVTMAACFGGSSRDSGDGESSARVVTQEIRDSAANQPPDSAVFVLCSDTLQERPVIGQDGLAFLRLGADFKSTRARCPDARDTVFGGRNAFSISQPGIEATVADERGMIGWIVITGGTLLTPEGVGIGAPRSVVEARYSDIGYGICTGSPEMEGRVAVIFSSYLFTFHNCPGRGSNSLPLPDARDTVIAIQVDIL